MSKSCFLYFISTANGPGPIKIGMAANPWARLRELQTATWEELGILALKDCGSASASRWEARLHRRFESLRIRGEWFDRSQELMDAICDLADSTEYIESPVTVEELNSLVRKQRLSAK